MCRLALLLRITGRSLVSLFASLALLMGLVLATAPTAQAHSARQMNNVGIVAHDGYFTMYPRNWRASSGMTEVIFQNDGRSLHSVQFFHLEGSETAWALANLASRQDLTYSQARYLQREAAGGASAVGSGGRQDVFLNLRPGRYVMVSMVDGHASQGMYHEFWVSGRAYSPRDSEDALRASGTPLAAAAIRLSNFRITIPWTLTQSRYQTVRINNVSSQAHDMVIYKLKAGRTRQDVLWSLTSGRGVWRVAWAAGGSATIPAYSSAWLEMYLTPGTYVALSDVVDVNHPHIMQAAKGMIATFTVRGKLRLVKATKSATTTSRTKTSVKSTTHPSKPAPTKKKTTSTQPARCSTDGAPPNPYCYTFVDTGKLIYRTPANFCHYFHCIPSFYKFTNGYVEQCRDGEFSHSGGRQGACSYHRGDRRPLYRQ